MTTPKALSRAQAERLVKRINESIEITVALIIEAFEGQAHLALGYKTWQAFAAAELPHYKYTPEARMRASVDLTQGGLSNRSAAAALGVSPKTVDRDVASNDAVRGGPDPSKPAPLKKKPAAGAPIKQQVEEYRAVMTKHPTWTGKSVREHLGISHQEVSRLRLLAQAPGEVQGYLYSGQLNPGVVEAVLSNQYVKDEDKLVVLRKIVSGVLVRSRDTAREIMEVIPQIQPYPDLVLRWSSPDLAMTFEQLKEELIDIRNSRVISKREQAEKAAEVKMMAESGFNALAWFDEVNKNLGLVEQMWPMLAANPWIRVKLVKQLAEIGDRMLRLSQGEAGNAEGPLVQ